MLLKSGCWQLSKEASARLKGLSASWSEPDGFPQLQAEERVGVDAPPPPPPSWATQTTCNPGTSPALRSAGAAAEPRRAQRLVPGGDGASPTWREDSLLCHRHGPTAAPGKSRTCAAGRRNTLGDPQPGSPVAPQGSWELSDSHEGRSASPGDLQTSAHAQEQDVPRPPALPARF